MVHRKTGAAFLVDVIAWDFFFSDRLNILRSKNPHHLSNPAIRIAGVSDQKFSCCLSVPTQVNRATEEECSGECSDLVERNIVEIV